MKRVKALDLMRGGMSFYIIPLHAVVHRVFASDSGNFAVVMSNIPLLGVIAISPVLILALWGTLYTFVSGASVTLALGQQLQKNPDNAKKLFRTRYWSAFILWVIYLLDKGLFVPRTSVHPIETFSLVTGTLENGIFTSPSLLHFVSSGTLEILAVSSILITFFLQLSWRKGFEYKKTSRRLLIAGIFVLASTFLLREFIGDPYVWKVALMESNLYSLYWIFLRFYAERFALFPVFAFTLFGAGFGIRLAADRPFKEIQKYGYISGFVLIGSAFSTIFFGFDFISGFAEEFVPLPMQFLNLGLQVILLTALLGWFDYRKKKEKKRHIATYQFLRKYSKLSLTIFIFEPFLSQLWYISLATLNGGPIKANFPLIVIFCLVVIISWLMLSQLWHEIEYRYSVEWIISKIRKYITSKRHWLIVFMEFSHSISRVRISEVKSKIHIEVQT